MHRVTISTANSSHKYPIIIGSNLLSNAPKLVQLKSYSKIFIVTDQTLERLWLPKLLAALPTSLTTHIVLPAGESAKQLTNLERVWEAMHQAGCDRHSVVISLGGGAVGDLAGFAASTYMRGVDCVHIPTTLLAQVDSSIGGKTAINFGNVKNLVGTFSQPVAVISDTTVLSTLSEREFVAGFAEIFKHAFIQDKNYLEQLTAKPLTDLTPDELAEIITTSCTIKGDTVRADTRESGARKALNFGHTVGHALEALSLKTSSPLLHGEAVSIGMAIEADISHSEGLLTAKEAAQVTADLTQAGLPIRAPRYEMDDILSKMRADKKNHGGAIQCTLLKHVGQAVWDHVISEEVITHAMQRNWSTTV